MTLRNAFASRGATQRPSVAQVGDWLSYNPVTGAFFWKRSTANGKAVAGDLAGSLSSAGYWQIGVLGRTHTAQQLAWLLTYGEWPAEEIDHISGDPLDNRLVNLRQCTKAENAQNRSESVIGAYEFRGRWRAKITVSGRRFHLGDYPTKNAAMAAYRQAKSEKHKFAPQLRAGGV